MALIAKQPAGGEFTLTPEGTYVARCFKVIDLGTSMVEYLGEAKKQHKISVSWELLDDKVRMDDGRPYAIGKTYTLSLHEKSSLYKDLVAWRGKSFTPEELDGFDIKNILGAYCMVQVIHETREGKTYAKMSTIMSTKEKPTPVNDPVWFDISEFDRSIFDGLSDWLKERIVASDEYKSANQVKGGTIAPSGDVVVEDISDEPIDLSEIPF